MKEISDFIKKAEKFLSTAKHVLSIGDYDSCVSRCYYAMFFMAEAALLTKGLSASSHKGVISLFGKRFVKTEIFERELGKALNDAYDKRLVGDLVFDPFAGIGTVGQVALASEKRKVPSDYKVKLCRY
ncbi:TPA: HEPN domain-containing protein [Candidatus Poribacteria bacterium]|nr:HEPN domain-containing protein [Candidatus Poribacteria bacterium]